MKPPLSHTERAQAAHAAAEAATDPRDKDAFRAAAKTWERLANPRVGGYSLEPHVLRLAELKRAVAEAPKPLFADQDRHAETPPGHEKRAVRYSAKQAAIIEF